MVNDLFLTGQEEEEFIRSRVRSNRHLARYVRYYRTRVRVAFSVNPLGKVTHKKETPMCDGITLSGWQKIFKQ